MPKAQAVSPAPDGGYPGGNTAEGTNALFSLPSTGFGGSNTANGFDALFSDTSGPDNTATGAMALYHNTTGPGNTATGYYALHSSTCGGYNTAIGVSSLLGNATGSFNTATGAYALQNNTIGKDNTADGVGALERNTTGGSNIALGYYAGYYLTTGSNNISIGNIGATGQANAIHLGNAVATLYPDGTTHPAQTATFIAGIHGTAVTGTAVVINSSGQLGVAPSSERFKDEIKPMDKASEAILALRPVTFRYKHELDPDGIPQFGLVVAAVNADLVVRDKNGEIYTVRYDQVNAMLLNEFLKEHRTVQELKSAVTKQEATIAQQRKDFEAQTAQQQKEIQALTASLTEQAAQIQKVSAQLEASKPAPQVVNNP